MRLLAPFFILIVFHLSICFGQIPVIYSVYPDNLQGNPSVPILLSIYGSTFLNSTLFSCQLNSQTVFSQYYNSTLAFCTLNPATQPDRTFSGQYSIQISNDGNLFSNSLSVNFFVLPQISSATPLEFTAPTTTETNITISGSWFETSLSLSFGFPPTAIWPVDNSTVIARLPPLPNAYALLPIVISNDGFLHNVTWSSMIRILPSCSGDSSCLHGGTWDERYCNCTSCALPWSGPLCDQCPITCSSPHVLNTDACSCVCPDGSDSPTCSDFPATTPDTNTSLVIALAVLTFAVAVCPLLLNSNSSVRRNAWNGYILCEARALLDYIQFVALYGLISVDFAPTVERFSAFFMWSNLVPQYQSLQPTDVYITEDGLSGSMSQSCYLSTQQSQMARFTTSRSLKSAAGSGQDTGVSPSLLFVSNLSTLLACVVGTFVLFMAIRILRPRSSAKSTNEIKHRMLWAVLSFALIGYSPLSTTAFFQMSAAQHPYSSATLLVAAALVIAAFSLPILIFSWFHSISVRRHMKHLPQWLLSSPLHQCLFTDLTASPSSALMPTITLAKKLLSAAFLGGLAGFPLGQIIGQIGAICSFVIVIVVERPYCSLFRLCVEIVLCVIQCVSLGLAIPFHSSPCSPAGTIPSVIIALHACGISIRFLLLVRALASAAFCSAPPHPAPVGSDMPLDYEKGLQLVRQGYVIGTPKRTGSILAPVGAIPLQDMATPPSPKVLLGEPPRLPPAPTLDLNRALPSSLTRTLDYLSRSPAISGYSQLDLPQDSSLTKPRKEGRSVTVMAPVQPPSSIFVHARARSEPSELSSATPYVQAPGGDGGNSDIFASSSHTRAKSLSSKPLSFTSSLPPPPTHGGSANPLVWNPSQK